MSGFPHPSYHLKNILHNRRGYYSRHTLSLMGHILLFVSRRSTYTRRHPECLCFVLFWSERREKLQSGCGGCGEPWEALLAKPGQRVLNAWLCTYQHTGAQALFPNISLIISESSSLGRLTQKMFIPDFRMHKTTAVVQVWYQRRKGCLKDALPRSPAAL